MGCGASTPSPPANAEPVSDSPQKAGAASKPPTEGTANAVIEAAATASPKEARKAAATPLRAIFDSIDVDGSGTVSQAELRKKLGSDDEVQKLLTAAGGDGKSHVWEQLDDDGDGKITWAEFEGWLSPDVGAFVDAVAGPGASDEGSGGPEESSEPLTLRQLFDSIDENGDGHISQAELMKKLSKDGQVQKLLTAMGGDGGSNVFAQLDVDGDGKITWSEFEMMLSADGDAFMDALGM